MKAKMTSPVLSGFQTSFLCLDPCQAGLDDLLPDCTQARADEEKCEFILLALVACLLIKDGGQVRIVSTLQDVP